MKTLIWKELRENVKVAALGLVIYTLVLLQQHSSLGAAQSAPDRPLTNDSFLMATAWFCGLFGAVLGWLQMHNERRSDLWAFLIHRPIIRTRIFLAKALVGLSLYALAAGLPLLGYTIWIWLPGHVAAPFQWLMVRPAGTLFLAGLVCYFAGMLTGLRRARWYASRGLGLGVAVGVLSALWGAEHYWQSFAVLLLGAGVLVVALWSGFRSDGYYEGQTVWGKAALTTSLLAGSVVVAMAAGLFLTNVAPTGPTSATWESYVMSQTGAVLRVTSKISWHMGKMSLTAEPLFGATTEVVTNRGQLNALSARGSQFSVTQNDRNHPKQWMQADGTLFSRWAGTDEEMWYYWDRYGRLVGYDRTSRRLIGSLGPKGFAADLFGAGDHFNNRTGGGHNQTLATDTTVFVVDVPRRTVKPLFESARDEPILAVDDVSPDRGGWDHTVVVTSRSIDLLTSKGKLVWKTPYVPRYPDYTRIHVWFLEPRGHYGLLIAPSISAAERTEGTLPDRVAWLTDDQGVTRSAEVPDLVGMKYDLGPSKALLGIVMPPPVLVAAHYSTRRYAPQEFSQSTLFVNGAVVALVCLPAGWWLGRRYRLPVGARLGWAVFHLLFGVPGLLAFLSVQEWPAREACPNCKKLRVVDRAQCEHCGAGFAPPEKTGTEVFAPLGAKVEAQAVG